MPPTQPDQPAARQTTISGPAPWVEALDADAATPLRVALVPDDGAWSATLRAPTGAGVLHVPLGLGKSLLCRCELPVDADGRVVLGLRAARDRTWRLADTPGLRVLAPESPAPPLPLAGGPGPWQIAFVIDRTTRWFDPAAAAPAGLLLATPSAWAPLCEQLVQFAAALTDAAGEGPQCAVLGFADAPIPEVAAGDLMPQRPVISGDERFRPWSAAQLAAALVALPASAGGDWVDALAEALVAAAALPWSAVARRLVVLFGDSPGYALAHPVGATADAQPREQDVDLAAFTLYAQGIELVTLYHRPPEAFSSAVPGAARAILAATAAQYRRLATSPGHAGDADGFAPADLAARLCARTGPLARGTSLGLSS